MGTVSYLTCDRCGKEKKADKQVEYYDPNYEFNERRHRDAVEGWIRVKHIEGYEVDLCEMCGKQFLTITKQHREEWEKFWG